MSKGSPAFQFYPGDFLSDSKVAVMSLEELGAYIRLLCHCWLEGSVPRDVTKLARLCGTNSRRMTRLLVSLLPCFEVASDGSSMTNPRIEKERIKQQKYREAQSEAGKRGAEKRWGSHSDPNSDPTSTPIAKGMANDSSLSLSSNYQRPSGRAGSTTTARPRGDPNPAPSTRATSPPSPPLGAEDSAALSPEPENGTMYNPDDPCPKCSSPDFDVDQVTTKTCPAHPEIRLAWTDQNTCSRCKHAGRVLAHAKPIFGVDATGEATPCVKCVREALTAPGGIEDDAERTAIQAEKSAP